MIGAEAQSQLKALLGPEYFSTRIEDLIMYGSDATNQPQYRPEAVARPGTVEEIAGLVRLARTHNFALIPRGAGSGLTGGALPIAGGLVCVMTRFNRILEIDADNLTAVVEPGVVTADFQSAVEKYGLFYPPDPASRDFSTLGGNAAENAGGTRAVKYGVTRDYILGLEVVLGTGEFIRTGVKTVKGVVGYDLTRLLIGSEGTLGVITRLILRLIPRPEAVETILAYFPDLDRAARTVAALTAARIIPSTLEFMDQVSINCVEDYLGLGLDRTAGGLLLIETDGTAAQARAEAEMIVALCGKQGAKKVRRAESANEAEDMWRARRAISPALYRAASGKLNEDIVVPRSLIPEMMAKMTEIGRNRNLQIICFGHAGDGNIHVNVMYDQAKAEEKARAFEAVRDIFSEVLALGGTLSGEHGIGTMKKAFIGMEIKPEALALMKRIKGAFDPDGIMNPGKVFPE